MTERLLKTCEPFLHFRQKLIQIIFRQISASQFGFASTAPACRLEFETVVLRQRRGANGRPRRSDTPDRNRNRSTENRPHEIPQSRSPAHRARSIQRGVSEPSLRGSGLRGRILVEPNHLFIPLTVALDSNPKRKRGINVSPRLHFGVPWKVSSPTACGNIFLREINRIETQRSLVSWSIGKPMVGVRSTGGVKLVPQLH